MMSMFLELWYSSHIHILIQIVFPELWYLSHTHILIMIFCFLKTLIRIFIQILVLKAILHQQKSYYYSYINITIDYIIDHKFLNLNTTIDVNNHHNLSIQTSESVYISIITCDVYIFKTEITGYEHVFRKM